MENIDANLGGLRESRLWRAMSWSLGIAIGMVFLKMGAYFITGSAAILSDAAEAIVHVVAVLFATYSLRLSSKPADATHRYGHAKIGFFSAGVEGSLILLVAFYIYFHSGKKLSYPEDRPARATSQPVSRDSRYAIGSRASKLEKIYL